MQRIMYLFTAKKRMHKMKEINLQRIPEKTSSSLSFILITYNRIGNLKKIRYKKTTFSFLTAKKVAKKTERKKLAAEQSIKHTFILSYILSKMQTTKEQGIEREKKERGMINND